MLPINLSETLFVLLYLNLLLKPLNLLLSLPKLLFSAFLCLFSFLLLRLVNIHLVFNLSELLGGIRVTENLIELLKILLKHIFNSGKLIAIIGSLLRKLLDVFNVTLMSSFWMSTKVERTVLEPLFISCNFIPMLFFLLLIRRLLRTTLNISLLLNLLISLRVNLARLSLVNIAANLEELRVFKGA